MSLLYEPKSYEAHAHNIKVLLAQHVSPSNAYVIATRIFNGWKKEEKFVPLKRPVVAQRLQPYTVNSVRNTLPPLNLHRARR